MKQYLDTLETILTQGVEKPAAREGMPGSLSRFGHQFRHDFKNGFPLLTTKKIWWKGVVVELLWFLRGDTNIKYLENNGVSIWTEDAYAYYKKRLEYQGMYPLTFKGFVDAIKKDLTLKQLESVHLGIPENYKLGDCGFQYGKVWRRWEGDSNLDQIQRVIRSLIKNPESRRHLVTAIDPVNDDNLALYWCHAFFQFNCRPLTLQERRQVWNHENNRIHNYPYDTWFSASVEDLDSTETPKYYLDVQLYQRSADVFLGVPFNIASYALLLQIIAQVCNMVPGEFIHTFGDVHIYDNHMDQVSEQLSRDTKSLPNVEINGSVMVQWQELGNIIVDDSITYKDFMIRDYNPHPTIKAELSTGIKK